MSDGSQSRKPAVMSEEELIRALDRAHRILGEPGDKSTLAEECASDVVELVAEVRTLRADAQGLAHIVQTVGSLQLAGAMSDEIAYALHAAVEGEHRLVDAQGRTVMHWPEQDLAVVAAELEQHLQAAIDGDKRS